MKRGMTLVELLVALAILAALSVAVSSWTVAAVRTSASVSRNLNWERAATAALDAIISDLITGDFSIDAARVDVHDNRLIINTRDTGPVEHEYTIDDFRLIRRSFRVDGSGKRTPSGAHTIRPLVGGVTSWTVAIGQNAENEERTLVVTLVGPGSLHRARTKALP
jgi:prepilin-type N-terminal cleavage/methylation domain-containing protein